MSYLKQHHAHMLLLPSDFLKLVVSAFNHLHQSRRGNVVYLLAKALGTTRPDGSDSLLPTSRIPMGLLEYIVTFFTASSVQKASDNIIHFIINIDILLSTIGSLSARLP